MHETTSYCHSYDRQDQNALDTIEGFVDGLVNGIKSALEKAGEDTTEFSSWP